MSETMKQEYASHELEPQKYPDAYRPSVPDGSDDIVDLSIADEAFDEYIASGKQNRPISELWQEMDL